MKIYENKRIMNSKESIAKNYIYNLVYQILLLILPLITTPYISRVLGAENIGIYSPNNSVTLFLFSSIWMFSFHSTCAINSF